MSENNIYSVSRLNQVARQMLEEQLGAVWITGEISNFSQPVSGHWYLTLKDEHAQVRGAMFRMKNRLVAFRPQNGMQVLVRANVSLYEPRGDYQLIIESMHPSGEGVLQQQFEALKLKLAAEGLFAQNLKKKLPHFCKRVGIVTSATGAALQDILHILQRRDPGLQVVVYPSAVQGREAAVEIALMIELANQRNETDVLIVGRGGGSLEDLWCFNEEIVARAIFNSRLPVISAVGHETDVTIADFAADLRAPTPSAAAELISRDQDELRQLLTYRQQRLEMALDRLFNRHRQRLQQLSLRLQHCHPQARLDIRRQHVRRLEQRLQTAMQRLTEKTHYKMTALCGRLANNPLPFYLRRQRQQVSQLKVRLNSAVKKNTVSERHRLSDLCTRLDTLSPLKVLARGYSLTENAEGHTLSRTAQVKTGELIRTRLTDGVIISKVEKTA